MFPEPAWLDPLVHAAVIGGAAWALFSAARVRRPAWIEGLELGRVLRTLPFAAAVVASAHPARASEEPPAEVAPEPSPHSFEAPWERGGSFRPRPGAPATAPSPQPQPAPETPAPTPPPEVQDLVPDPLLPVPAPAADAPANTPRIAPERRDEAGVLPRCGGRYAVVPGDSLWSIAERALDRPPAPAVDSYWREIYAANRDVIGADPDLIHPGTVLKLPRACT